jgi:hypothetical protein
MTIEMDVRNVAADFGIDAALIQAVVNAEGNIVKAVQCSIPSVTTREQALRVLCRSAVHAMSDWVRNDPARREAYVQFFGARWAPVGVANDPKGLNANWVPNVTDLWV